MCNFMYNTLKDVACNVYIFIKFNKTQLKKQSDGYGRYTISPDMQLLVALWTMAIPDSYRSVCDRFNIGRATAWRANRRVCAAIYSLVPQLIKWPNEEEAEYTIYYNGQTLKTNTSSKSNWCHRRYSYTYT